MMRVLHVIESLGSGGAERRLLNDVTRLQQEFSHTVVHLFPEAALRSRFEQQGIPTIGLGAWGLSDARALPALATVIRRVKPDLIHTQLFGADLYGRLAGRWHRVPVVSTVQASVYEDPEPFHQSAKRIRERVDRWTARLCVSRLVAVSEFVKRSMERCLRFPGERIDVIPNAVDPEPFERVDLLAANRLRQELGLSEGCAVLITTGKLIPTKGHAVALEALARLRERPGGWYWLVVGDGICRAALERHAQTLGLGERVRFLGRRHDIPELLALSDLFVFPSTSAEGMPLALLEAMAAGKACVGFAAGPVPEVIQHGVTGLLVPPASASDLAAAIAKLLEDAACRTAMGRAGRLRIHEHFHADEAARRLGTLYRSVANRS